MKFNKVNEFLSKLEPVSETDVVLNGPDVIKNIVVSEIMDINRLSALSSELLTILSKDIKSLSRKEQQSFWKDVEAVNARKEDFVFKIAQESNKNNFMQKILNLSAQPNEKVISENGEVFESSVTDETRTQLQALLVDMLNDTTRIL